MKKLVLALATAAVSALSSNAIAAGSATGTMLVSAVVIQSCLITAVPLNFLEYKPTQTTATTGTTTVAVVCNGVTSGSMKMGHGQNSIAGTRQMVGPLSTDKLSYTLFQPTSGAPLASCASATTWGDGSDVGTALTVTGLALPSIYNVCGSIPPGQTAALGAYLDSVTVTLEF